MNICWISFDGSAYDPVQFEFVGDVKNDQRVEIERMHALLVTLYEDPRANLKPGLTDAGIAIKNLRLISSLAKPPGFVDPNNPNEIPKAKKSDKKKKKDDSADDGIDKEEDAEEAKQKPTESESRKRYPMLSFSNTDMAFSGDTLVAGNYHGFNVYDLADLGYPNSSVPWFVVNGGQGDVSIVGDLLIMPLQASSTLNPQSTGLRTAGHRRRRERRTLSRTADFRHQRFSDAKAGIWSRTDLPRLPYLHSVVAGRW